MTSPPFPHRIASERSSRARPTLRRAWCLGLVLLADCSADAVGTETTTAADSAMFEGPPFFESDDAWAPTQGSPHPSSEPGFVEPLPDPGTTQVACITQEMAAELVEQPVDIILLLDNSGSMSDELGAVEANINVNFASILASSDVDYRLVLISRHRREAREASEEASTSICVSSPLSGLDDCSAAKAPVLSDRFFQYNTKIESKDSFDVLLDTYAPPFEDSEREADQAPLGWSTWLRPNAKKVFLEMTDDDEDMPISEFVAQLLALGPEHFGLDPAHPSFVFHSIIGLAEKFLPTAAYLPHEAVQTETCTGNGNDVENAGESYQELSRLTGGLRFPLCQFGAYDVVFRRIAEDVVQTREIACDFPLPPPPLGLELDLDNVAIEYAPGGTSAAVRFGQALRLEDCVPNAFYIADGRLNLCPSTCGAVRADPVASVTVLFTCESQLIVPR